MIGNKIASKITKNSLENNSKANSQVEEKSIEITKERYISLAKETTNF